MKERQLKYLIKKLIEWGYSPMYVAWESAHWFAGERDLALTDATCCIITSPEFLEIR